MFFHIIHDWSKWSEVELVEVYEPFLDVKKYRREQKRECLICGKVEYRSVINSRY